MLESFCLFFIIILEESRTKWQRTRRTAVPPFFVGYQRPEGLPNTGTGGEIQQKLSTDPPGTSPYIYIYIFFFSLFDPTRNIHFYSAYKVTAEQAADLGENSRNAIDTNN